MQRTLTKKPVTLFFMTTVSITTYFQRNYERPKSENVVSDLRGSSIKTLYPTDDGGIQCPCVWDGGQLDLQYFLKVSLSDARNPVTGC